MENTNNYISVAELAKILQISHVAVFKKIKNGQIPAEKIGRNYAIPKKYIDSIENNIDVEVLTDDKKKEIEKAVKKVVKEYGETLRLLGKE